MREQVEHTLKKSVFLYITQEKNFTRSPSKRICTLYTSYTFSIITLYAEKKLEEMMTGWVLRRVLVVGIVVAQLCLRKSHFPQRSFLK